MADAKAKHINTSFQGLVTTCVIFAVVGGISAITYESLRQLRRLPAVRFSKFWRKDAHLRYPPGGVQDTPVHARDKDTCEDWEMGHFYHSRVFHASTPSPPLPRWPFAWVKRAISFTDEWYAEHTGMDTVVYVRFLRACFFWVLLHTLTTAPTLLAIHITFSRGVNPTDMARASLSYLVSSPAPGCDPNKQDNCPQVANEKGRSLLWVHLLLLWYITITWVLALVWIGKGSLRIRRAQIEKTREKVFKAKEQARDTAQGITSAPTHGATLERDPQHTLSAAQGFSSDNSDGWRQRTLMVMNLPNTMRDEASIRRYFEEFMRPDDDDEDDGTPSHDSHSQHAANSHTPSSRSPHGAHDAEARQTPASDSDDRSSPREHVTRVSSHSEGPSGAHLKSPIQTVVLIRKMNELASMLSRRQEVLTQLEAAHVKLAQDVLVTVGRRTLKMRRAKQKQGRMDAENQQRNHTEHTRSTLSRLRSSLRRPFGRRKQPQRSGDEEGGDSGNSTPSENLDPDLEKLGAATHANVGKALEEELARRLARFSPTNRGVHAKQAQVIDAHGNGDHEMPETVWEALSELPRELLDPFQPATRLSALFRGQTVPTIDYLLTKLNLLTALVNEMRSRPPSSYEPTSTAFVTFRDPRQARMVWRELKDQIVVKVRLAPEVKDLDWDRLMKTSFTGDVVRGFGVSVVTWAFTIFWVLMINFVVLSIFSVDKLSAIPGLGNFFNANPKLKGFVSITLPPLLVSLASMSVPELIFQVSKRAQGFVTFSALYDMCLARYWKFVICNVVIFFSVGSTVIVTVLTKVGESGSILNTIGSAFPSAAPFFVSYLILQLALQSGFEHMGFMIALLQHWGARKATTPRVRAIKTLPRNFNRYYWLPLHLNIMAIVFIFALLNPLVIPFAWVYLALALVVFKKNFAYHYYRRFNEMEGVIYFTRLLRYSLDAIVVMQAVLLIFFSVIRRGPVYIGMTAVLIPLTVITKLIATRLWKSQCRAVDDEEAEALCGIDSRPLWEKMQRRDLGSSTPEEASGSRAPLDALASGRFPSVVPPPRTDSRVYRVWQRLHDSFNANGLDKPSYIATAHAKGRGDTSAVGLGARGLARTPRYVIKETAKRAFHFRSAGKAAFGIDDPTVDSPRASRDTRPSGERRPVSGLPPTSRLNIQQLDDANETAGDEHADGEVLNGESTAFTKSKSGLRRSKNVHVIHRRRGSSRSEERPFLSGFDAIAAHAPLPSEDVNDLSFEDGDAPFLEHDQDGKLERVLSRRSRRSVGRYGTLRRKPSQLATVADEDDPRSSGTEPMSDAGDTSLDPLYPRQAQHIKSPTTIVVHPASKWAQPSEPSTVGYNDDDSLKGRALVKPHPPVRWDDTPSNTARYNNPFYNQEMDEFLWLPRNPLAPLDLFDTIEWYGPALVSSQGGSGIVGEWEDDQSDQGSGDEHQSHYEATGEHEDEIPLGGEAATFGRSTQIMLDGDEEILLPDSLARHLEEKQNVEEVVDPAASLPKDMLEDYKRAVGDKGRRASNVSRHSSSRSPARSTFRRSSSNVSNNSAQGYSGPALLHVPSHGSWRSNDGLQAPASPTSMRTSNRPGTGDSQPLASVAEGGVMIPRRGSSRRKQTNDTAVDGGEMAAEDGDQVSPVSPTKAREASAWFDGHMSRRAQRRDVSGALSRASGLSGGTAQRTVTLKAALRAEALEEERRLTLKEQLAAAKRRKKRHAARAASGHLEGLEEGGMGDEQDGQDGARGRDKKSRIMGRYEAQHRRHEKEMSEAGPTKESEGSQLQLGDVSVGSLTSRSGGVDRIASAPFHKGARLRTTALGVLSLSRAGRATDIHGAGEPMPLQMQELNRSGASQAHQGRVVEEQAAMERSMTEMALPAEASRTSALVEHEEVPHTQNQDK